MLSCFIYFVPYYMLRIKYDDSDDDDNDNDDDDIVSEIACFQK